MSPNIIQREIIDLPEKQLQMLRSGWGSAAIDDTIVEAIVYMSDGYEVQGYLAYPKGYGTKKQNQTTEHTEFTEKIFKDADASRLNGLTQREEFSALSPQPSYLIPDSVASVSSVVETETSANGKIIPNTSYLIPCLVWNRGGSKERGAIDRFTAKGMFGQLASWGFVVFASSYRASFNDDLQDEFGGSEVNDILNLMEIAKDIPFADTSRWAMEGWSRGGMMTYLALRKRHDVKVAIISGGITDVAGCCANVPRIQATLQQLVENEGIRVYEKRSAINFADELPKDCKYLILHGTKDDTIPPIQAIKISEIFLELGLHFRLVLLEEADHFLKGKKKEVDQFRKDWLLKYV